MRTRLSHQAGCGRRQDIQEHQAEYCTIKTWRPASLQAVVPCKFHTAKQLVSHNIHSSTYNYKYTFSVEIVPVCKVREPEGCFRTRDANLLFLKTTRTQFFFFFRGDRARLQGPRASGARVYHLPGSSFPCGVEAKAMPVSCLKPIGTAWHRQFAYAL